MLTKIFRSGRSLTNGQLCSGDRLIARDRFSGDPPRQSVFRSRYRRSILQWSGSAAGRPLYLRGFQYAGGRIFNGGPNTINPDITLPDGTAQGNAPATLCVAFSQISPCGERCRSTTIVPPCNSRWKGIDGMALKTYNMPAMKRGRFPGWGVIRFSENQVCVQLREQANSLIERFVANLIGHSGSYPIHFSKRSRADYNFGHSRVIHLGALGTGSTKVRKSSTRAGYSFQYFVAVR
jgi:hypothetical protein